MELCANQPLYIKQIIAEEEIRVYRVLTLLYHRINDLIYDKNLLAVTPDNFYKQMSYLKEKYRIVRFEEDWNNLDENAVCITFDDGYMDNFTNALPILSELQIPATIFISTGNINTNIEFWWDELERILLERGKKYNDSFVLQDEMFSCQWPTESLEERVELYDTLHWLMYDKISVEKRKNWIKQLQKWSNSGNEGRTKNQAIQMDKIDLESPLLTIGAHTVNHPSLKNLSEQEQYYEIYQSIRELQVLFKRDITVFSYPFGSKNDFDNITIDICKDVNIKKAAANYPGIWKQGCDEYQIPRNIVRNWSIDKYIQKIEEFWKIG